MQKVLGRKTYEVQLTKELKPADHRQRGVFADCIPEMHENYREFHRKIMMTDDGFVNKQNYRI